MKNIILLLIVSGMVTLLSAAVPDKELARLYKQASQAKTSASYLDVCDYYLDNLPSPYTSLEVYFDSAHQAAVKENSAANLARYYSTYATYHYYQDSLRQFRDYKLKALELYQQIHADADIASCYSDLGLYHNCIGETEAERGYLRKGLDILNQKKIENGDLIVMLSNMGISYLQDGMYPQALQYAQEAYEHAILQKDTTMMIEALNTQGVTYRKQALVDECVKKYQEALLLCEATGKLRRLPVLYLNISVAYTECKRYREAAFFADKGREAALRVNDNRSLCRIYGVYNVVFSAQKNYAAAADSTRKRLFYARIVSSSPDCLDAYLALAILYNKMDVADSTWFYLGKADSLVDRHGEKLKLENYYQDKGVIYQHMNRFQEAIHFYQKALIPCHQANRTFKLHTLYADVSHCYARLNDYKKAYAYLDSSYDAHKKVYNQDMQERLSDLSVKYKTQEKELKIRQLTQARLEEEARNIKRRNQFLVVLVVLVVVLALLVYYLQAIKLKNIRLADEAKEEERRFQLLQKDTEVKLTRQYIDGLEEERKRLAKDLHDGVCNDLLGLQMLFSSANALTPEFKNRFLTLLQDTGRNVRDISHELMPPAFQYATIDEILSDYISNLNEASPSLTLSYQSSENVDWGRIPSRIGYEMYRIVQEALTNVFKHGRVSRAKVSLLLENNTLVLKVVHENVDHHLSAKGKGIGLRTIQERVKTISGELEWIETEKTIGVLVWLPLQGAGVHPGR